MPYDLSISIVSWKVKDLLEECLSSIYNNQWQHSFEVFVVDNNSQDGTVEMIKEKFPQVKLIENKENLGFTITNNQAIRQSQGRYILLLNPDTIVHPNSLDLMIEFMDHHPEVGAIGPKLLNPNGTLQRSCLGFPTLGALVMRNLFVEYLFPKNPFTRKYLLTDWDHLSEREVDQPMGSALLVRKEVIDQVGLLDENITIFFDEVDLCYRIKSAGWKIYFYPKAEITHYGGQSIKKWKFFQLSHHWNKSRDYYFKKHFGSWAVFILWLSEVGKILIALLVLILIFLTFKNLFRLITYALT